MAADAQTVKSSATNVGDNNVRLSGRKIEVGVESLSRRVI
jgi:hypothetical protein